MNENRDEQFQVMEEDHPFFVANVTPFRDTRLSWKARGLMTYFIDKPKGWKFWMKHIIDSAPDGETSVLSGLRELKKYGYLVRVAFRKGKLIDRYEWFVYPTPVKYPSEKDLHVQRDEWEEHRRNGGTKDITVFVKEQKEKKKTAKLLGKSQVGENPQPQNPLGDVRLGKTQVPENSGSRKSPPILNTNLLPSTNDLSKYVGSKQSPLELYEENFKKASKYVKESLEEFEKQYGMELLLEAMYRAIEKDADTPVSYIRGTLRNWEALGLKTAEEVIDHEKRYYEEKHNKRNSNKPAKKVEKKPTEEKIPQALKLAEEQSEQLQLQQPANEEDMEEKQRQIQEKLKEMNEKFNQKKERKPELAY